MAPGPLGQCHPMPDDEGIRREMINIAASYQKVHDMYNFDYDPQPGTALYEVDQRIKRVSMCACVCVCVCVRAVCWCVHAGACIMSPQSLPSCWHRYTCRHMNCVLTPEGPTSHPSALRCARMPSSLTTSRSCAVLCCPASVLQALELHKRRLARLDEAVSGELELEQQQQGGPQLLASVADQSAFSAPPPTLRPWSLLPRFSLDGGGSSAPAAAGGPFASMSMGMGRATRTLFKTLERAARHVPSRRPHIIRPSEMLRRPRPQDQKQQQQQ